MRLESIGKEGQYNVWMTDDDLAELRRATTTHRDDLIIQLGGFVGLRAFEMLQVCPKHVKRTDDVEGDLHRYQNVESLARDEPFIDLSERGVRAAVKRTAERAADRTGDPDCQYISSYDLRRRFAQRLLVDEHVNPRVVMQVGGWDSFQAIEPYLNAPTPDVVNREFEQVDV